MHPWLRLALSALLCAWPLSPGLHAQTPQRVTAHPVSPQQVTIDAHAPTTELSDNVIVGDRFADHSKGLSAVGGYVRPLPNPRSTLVRTGVVS